MQRKTLFSGLIALFLTASAAAFGQSGEKAKVKGMVTSRSGETLIVKSRGETVTVVLTDDMKTQDKKGLFGLEKELLANSVLIPGLKVDVNGTSDGQDWILAKTITVDGDDLETAQMIQSGLHPTAEQVAANMRTLESHHQSIASHDAQLAAQKDDIETNEQNIAANKQQIEQNIKDIEENTQRFMALHDYDVKGEATVKFGVGSTKISASDQEQLKQLAQTATGLKGYLIEVTGYADSTGSPSMNTKLSENRAKAVSTFLMQQGNVPIRRTGRHGRVRGCSPQ